MRTSLVSIIVSVLAAATLAACGSSSSPIKDDAALVKDLRGYIPSASAYDDEYLLSISDKVCSLGREDGSQILDNYSDLESSDYDAFVTVVFGVNGCPNDADK